MTSGSAARRRRAAQARRADDVRTSGVTTDHDRHRRRRLTWIIDSDPFLALWDADRLRQRLEDQVLPDLVAAARRVGYTWADIGEALGVTRQSAHSRFGDVDG